MISYFVKHPLLEKYDFNTFSGRVQKCIGYILLVTTCWCIIFLWEIFRESYHLGLKIKGHVLLYWQLSVSNNYAVTR